MITEKIKVFKTKKAKEREEKRKFKEELEDWKKAIIKRDGHKCQLCNKYIKKKSSLNVHHIIPNIKRYRELATDINNGILLDPYCHKWSHISPHHNSLYFSLWLQKNKKEQYQYLKNFFNKS